jgi:release factor glutamine methyltransferase
VSDRAEGGAPGGSSSGPEPARSLLARGSARLRQAGVSSPNWDSERLLLLALGLSRSALLASPALLVDPAQVERYLALLERRAAREPLQHLFGFQPFWRHEFRVSPDVLIPRPETELVVEACLGLIEGRRSPLIVDVGTGSGCIAISIAAERPDATVHATEISPAALEIARENARALGVEGRVTFHLGDLLAPMDSLRRRIEVVASNPPYIDARSRASLPPEVRDHEPTAALFPPDGDPLFFYRRLAQSVGGYLRPGGHLVVEVGLGMAEEVAALFDSHGLVPVRTVPDLQQIPRTLVACLPDDACRS